LTQEHLLLSLRKSQKNYKWQIEANYWNPKTKIKDFHLLIPNMFAFDLQNQTEN